MLTVDEIAYYIIREYKAKYHHSIDLKKIGKLLYFAQRESYIVRDMPLFEEEIYAVKSGPTAYIVNVINLRLIVIHWISINIRLF